ncbi:MAG: magnesium transporter [Mycobacterium sp.]|jgi:magnesium transporter|nr:magnesium transporter [Mycobacterium sp.]
MICVGPDFVMTVRHDDFSRLTGVRKEMDADPHHLRLGPFALVLANADHVVDGYRDVSVRVETDIDSTEEQILSPRSTTDIDQIYLLKREILELRRAVNPLSDALHEIVSEDKDLICKEVLRYLRDVIDHQTMAAERINTCDELLTSLVTAALGPDEHAAEPRPAEDFGLGRDRFYAHHAGRHLRHDLRGHAGDALDVGLPRGAWGDGHGLRAAPPHLPSQPLAVNSEPSRSDVEDALYSADREV